MSGFAVQDKHPAHTFCASSVPFSTGLCLTLPPLAGPPAARASRGYRFVLEFIVQHSGAVCQAALVRKTRLVCARDPGSAIVARASADSRCCSLRVFAVALAIRSVETPGGRLLPSGPRLRVNTLCLAKKTFPSPLFVSAEKCQCALVCHDTARCPCMYYFDATLF